MKTTMKLILAMAVVVVAIGLAVARSHSATWAAPTGQGGCGAIAVTVQSPRWQPVPNNLSVTGTISAQDQLSVGSGNQRPSH